MGVSGFELLKDQGFVVIYTGTYQRSLDGKARFLLPKRMRAELAETNSLFLTPGTDHCLELHTPESLHELAKRANQSAAGSKNVKSFSRLFYAQAEQCEIDGQGRIRIPNSLTEYADLTKDIVIVGVGFSWEIWNQQQWQSYLKSNQDEFDKIAQTTFDHANGVLSTQFVAKNEKPFPSSLARPGSNKPTPR